MKKCKALFEEDLQRFKDNLFIRPVRVLKCFVSCKDTRLFVGEFDNVIDMLSLASTLIRHNDGAVVEVMRDISVVHKHGKNEHVICTKTCLLSTLDTFSIDKDIELPF